MVKPKRLRAGFTAVSEFRSSAPILQQKSHALQAAYAAMRSEGAQSALARALGLIGVGLGRREPAGINRPRMPLQLQSSLGMRRRGLGCHEDIRQSMRVARTECLALMPAVLGTIGAPQPENSSQAGAGGRQLAVEGPGVLTS